ncbi:MAG: DUF1109 domain-containing protein [Sphingomonadaceae bacterium]|nr:DUF1109 domain-containing protein [Sphingomonadaceae bacterium]
MTPETGRRAPNPLIDQLAEDLAPVRTLKLRHGLALVTLALVATVLAVEFIKGLWMVGITGDASPFFYIGTGLLLVLGAAAATSVVTMASPRVGNRNEGPKWALAMAMVLPGAALLTLLGKGPSVAALGHTPGLHCLESGVASSLLVAGALVLWLRRGAPVSPNTAGLLVGIASTALGSAAYGLSCQLDSMIHIGIWHAAPVAVGAVVGRFALPPLIRW